VGDRESFVEAVYDNLIFKITRRVRLDPKGLLSARSDLSRRRWQNWKIKPNKGGITYVLKINCLRLFSKFNH